MSKFERAISFDSSARFIAGNKCKPVFISRERSINFAKGAELKAVEPIRAAEKYVLVCKMVCGISSAGFGELERNEETAK